ncbi:tetratricopeptide repeat protein [Thiolapillus sp.]
MTYYCCRANGKTDIMKGKPIPIWQNFPGVFRYGFRPQPLLLIAGMSVLLYLSSGGILSWATSVILDAMLFKYAFVVLQQTARGNMDPPPLNLEVLAGDYDLPLKFYALILAFNILVGSDMPLAALVAFVALAAFPASIMVLALNESIVDAFNPVLLWRLIIRVGWSYLALIGLLFILQIAESNAVGLLAGGVHWIFYHLVTGYFAILTFHVMGYILYQNYAHVGQPVDEEEDAADARLAHFESMMALGNKEAAIAELQQLIVEYPDDLGIHRRLHQLCLLERKGKDLFRHARSYMPLLLREGRDAQAAELYQDCRALGENCAPDDAEGCYRLGRALRGAGKYREVIDLLNGLHKRFPRSDFVPHAYFLMARTLSESLNKDDLAVKALRFIVDNYAGHPVLPDVKAYLAVLQTDAP